MADLDDAEEGGASEEALGEVKSGLNQTVVLGNAAAAVGGAKSRNTLLGVQISMGDSPFQRTTYVRVMPRYTLANRSNRIIQICQDSNKKYISQAEPGLIITPPARDTTAADGSKDLKFLLRVVDDQGVAVTEWSKGLLLDREAAVPMRLWPISPGGEAVHVLCEKRHWTACTFLNVLEQEESAPLMAIENNSSVVIEAWQKNCEPIRAVRVAPGEREVFSWDDAEGLLEMEVRAGDGEKVSVDLLKLGAECEVTTSQSYVVHCESLIEGVTRTLVCNDMETVEEKKREANKAETLVVAEVQSEGVGVSVLDDDRRELLYMCLGKATARAEVQEESVLFGVHVATVQTDNHTGMGPRVMLVSPYLSSSSSSADKGAKTAFVDASMSLRRDVIAMQYWKEFNIAIDLFLLQIQESTLHELLGFEGEAKSQELGDSDEGFAGMDALTGATEANAETILQLSFLRKGGPSKDENHQHFEKMELSKVESEVTVLGLEGVAARKVAFRPGPIHQCYRQVGVIQKTAKILPDIHAAEMKLDRFKREDLSLQPGKGLGGALWQHYKRGVIASALNLMGSGHFWSNMLGSAGASPEQVLQRAEEKAKQRAQTGRVVDVGEGVNQGLKSVGEGFTSGLFGLWEAPALAASNGGNFGDIMGGIGSGLLGTITKPVSGVLEGFSTVADGIHSQVMGKVRTPLVRKRRAQYWDGVARGYEAEDAMAVEAFGQATLAREKGGGKFVGFAKRRGAAEWKEGDGGLLVREERVQMVRGDKLDVVEWELPLESLREIKAAPQTGSHAVCLIFSSGVEKLLELRDEKAAARMISRVTQARASLNLKVVPAEGTEAAL